MTYMILPSRSCFILCVVTLPYLLLSLITGLQFPEAGIFLGINISPFFSLYLSLISGIRTVLKIGIKITAVRELLLSLNLEIRKELEKELCLSLILEIKRELK